MLRIATVLASELSSPLCDAGPQRVEPGIGRRGRRRPRYRDLLDSGATIRFALVMVSLEVRQERRWLCQKGVRQFGL